MICYTFISHNLSHQLAVAHNMLTVELVSYGVWCALKKLSLAIYSMKSMSVEQINTPTFGVTFGVNPYFIDLIIE